MIARSAGVRESSATTAGPISLFRTASWIGPADVNADGLIEYSEIHAFVASANREIEDPRAVPAATLAFLRTFTKEAELPHGGPDEIRLDSLKFALVQTAARGSVDAAYRQALFASPYGVTYYKGFIDSTGAVGVKFEGAAPVVRKAFSKPPSYRKLLSIGCLAVAGASTIASIVTAVLAAGAKRDFDDTTLQRPAHDANERYVIYGNTALITGVLAGWLLWPNDAETPPVRVGGMPGEASGLVMGFSW